MSNRFLKTIFNLYERRRLRNWFYTLAFAIFVPVGLRFAIVAWRLGDWFDKPLSILAGVAIGITAGVTLMRVWVVPPRQTMHAAAGMSAEHAASTSMASEMYGVSRHKAALNRTIARDAAALGASRGWPFVH